MIIKAGTKLYVMDRRKGNFYGVAEKDFDTEKDEFYPIITSEYVAGMANDWEPGERIPCRKGISTVFVNCGAKMDKEGE